MIYDHLDNLPRYAALHPDLRRVADFLSSTDVAVLEKGTMELGGGLRCIVAEYRTAAAEECILETHRRFVDLHITIEGEERIGIAPRARCEPSGRYDEEKDCQIHNGKVSPLHMPAGMFAVFFPDDAHMSGLLVRMPGEFVRKLIFKLPAAIEGRGVAADQGR